MPEALAARLVESLLAALEEFEDEVRIDSEEWIDYAVNQIIELDLLEDTRSRFVQELSGEGFRSSLIAELLELESLPSAVEDWNERDLATYYWWEREYCRLGRHLFLTRNLLGSIPSPPQFELDEKAREDGFLFEVRQWVETLPDMWKRLGALQGLGAAHESEDSVLEYIRMSTRCYIAGLEAESIVFLRSALETAVRNRFDAVNEHQPRTMRQRLDWALHRRWITEASYRDALKVWERGNHVVHNQPGARTDPIDTMKILVQVLSDLHPWRDE